METQENFTLYAISVTVVVSYVYYLLLNKIKQGSRYTNLKLAWKQFLARKISGFLILGLIPATFAYIFFDFNPQLYLGFSGSATFHWVLQALVIILLLFMNFINARNVEIQSNYPEMRIKTWSVKSLQVAWFGWLIYLIGYEYLFRGILLFSCIDTFGVWLAVVINLALYSALHLPKGFKEAIAAIPFGAILCYLTIESNSIVPAILIHTIQAISAETACIYSNKSMHFITQLSKKNRNHEKEFI